MGGAWWERYRAHLRSEYWQRVRRALAARAGHKCERCKRTYADGVDCFQCHHTNYRVLGAELDHLDTLLWYCRDCHRWTHHRSSFDPMAPPTDDELRRLIRDLGKPPRLRRP